MAQEVLDCCYDTGMTDMGVIYVDTRAGEYTNLKLPSNWLRIDGGLDLQPCKQFLFRMWPDEKCYGLLCDDTFPQTEAWDEEINEAANDWNLAEANDLWIAEKKQGLYSGSVPVPYCYGGKLLRTIGWMSLEGCKRACGDDVLSDIFCYILPQRRRFVETAVIEHRKPNNGKRQGDETDNPVRDGVDIIHQDRIVLQRWRNAGGPQLVAHRIKQAMEKAGVDPE